MAPYCTDQRGGRPANHPYNNIHTPSIILARTSKVDSNPALKVLSIYRPISVKLPCGDAKVYDNQITENSLVNPDPGAPQKLLLEHPGEYCAVVGDIWGWGSIGDSFPLIVRRFSPTTRLKCLVGEGDRYARTTDTQI